MKFSIKTIFNTVLALCMVVSMLPVMALAAPAETLSGTYGEEITWALTKDGTLTISGKGEMEDGRDVPWADNTDSIKYVVISDGVTTIGDYAFFGCYNLSSITIPYSVTSIGEAAFANCYNLRGITIPDSVVTIGDFAFAYCYKLSRITLPKSITSIGESTFEECGSLSSVTIPNSVTTIGAYAFRSCTNLGSITLPSGVTDIGESAFQFCSSLNTVTIPDGVIHIGVGAFDCCEKLSSVTIPESVASIGAYAFTGGYSLSNVYFCGSESQWNEIVINAPALPEGVTINYSDGTSSDYVHKHSYTYKTTITEPTCREQGYTAYACYCGETYIDDYVEVLDHTEVIGKSALDPTCTTDGVSAGSKCSVCGETIKAKEKLSALGHSWDEGTVTESATKKAEGVMTFTCIVCGETRTETIGKLESEPIGIDSILIAIAVVIIAAVICAYVIIKKRR